MELTVKVKSVFGVDRIYPACEKSELFNKLTAGTTMMPRDIEVIKELGYTVKVEEQSTI